MPARRLTALGARAASSTDCDATIFAVGPGKVDIDVIWTGSDDGLVHVTRDGGGSWKNVTPLDMPAFARVSLIDASAFDAGKAYVSARLPLLDDFRPHVWRTEDYGETWTRIVDGIRDDAYVNSVREDLNREGLLYAGTNHGVYVTFDDGGWWQELNPGLPDMPVTDVIPEHDELGMASHGRGFWVLDNVGPLRQWEGGSEGVPGTAERDLVLFEPAVAYRSGGGVVLSWWMGEGVGSAEEATLEVFDATGRVVRTFEPAKEGEERDRWSGPALPVGTGLQRVRWDLRTDPAATFPGMILWGVRTMAPAVPPGTYGVRLTVGDGHEMTAIGTTQVEVRRNPWIEGVTDEDLVAQYKFGVRVRDEVDRANRAVIEIRRVKGELEERLEGVEDEGLIEAAERLRVALEEIEGEIYQVRNRSNQDPLNFPIKVNNRLANLLSMSERGDGRPGEGMVEVFGVMVEVFGVMVGRLGGLLEGLEGVMREVEAFLEGEFEAVNEGLRATGGDEIVPGGVGVGVDCFPSGGSRRQSAGLGTMSPRCRFGVFGKQSPCGGSAWGSHSSSSGPRKLLGESGSSPTEAVWRFGLGCPGNGRGTSPILIETISNQLTNEREVGHEVLHYFV